MTSLIIHCTLAFIAGCTLLHQMVQLKAFALNHFGHYLYWLTTSCRGKGEDQ